jgi:hypothetical protein
MGSALGGELREPLLDLAGLLEASLEEMLYTGLYLGTGRSA